MKDVDPTFLIPHEEWYTFDRSPRPNVSVLANVDENSYRPTSPIRMGDHPVVWTNPAKPARNIYFLMGHDNGLFTVKNFCRMFDNAMEWAVSGGDEARKRYPANYAREPRFRALAYYSEHVEEAHVEFATQAVEFFRRLNYGKGFELDVVTDFKSLTYEKLSTYDIVIMLNNAPSSKGERENFQRYMENGGGWLGFHAAAYNDKSTNWPWFVDFLGGGVFHYNNWPPQPVKLDVDQHSHPVTRNLPMSFIAPESEWYAWTPSPRINPNVDVLLTLSTDNFPLGIKDIMMWGDIPVVWTNRKYRMIYLNMGHGDDEFTDATQKLLFVNAFRWVIETNPAGNPFLK
jgi:type 1 glutamine amidotransferase